MFRKLGSAKYKIVRVFAYITVVNLVILVQVNGWQLWYLAVPPIFVLLYWFETKYGIPGEQEVGWEGNANFREMKKTVEETKERVNEIYFRMPQNRPPDPEIDYQYITLSTEELGSRSNYLRGKHDVKQ